MASVAMQKLFWVLLSFFASFSCLLFKLEAQVQPVYSTNPEDYDFGWIANGTYNAGSVPACTYCVNALGPGYPDVVTDPAQGPNWNRTVGMYRCDGVQMNEQWAYDESTGAIVFSNLTTPLCIDAVFWDSLGLKLRDCNSSAISQRWTIQGSAVVSGLVGSGGEKLFLLGTLPDKNNNPTNQQYAYSLNLSSSLPDLLGSGLSYTSNFTFLSEKSLVDSSSNTFTTKGLLDIAGTRSTVGEIVNGGFESSTIQAGADITASTWIQDVPSYLALCGWVIDYGPIDYVKSGLLPPADGLYSVHLNTFSDTNHYGSISQTFRTDVEMEYVLSFFFNAFPPNLQIPSRTNWSCSATYSAARLQVGVTDSSSGDSLASKGGAVGDGSGGLAQNFTIYVTNDSPFMGWQNHTVTFRAMTNVTTISFTSLNYNDSCGPMVDEVKVFPFRRPGKKNVMGVVVGSIVGFLVLALAVLLGIVYGRRCFWADQDYSGLYKTENARVFSVKQLSASTKKFSNVLGEGGFGTVYKAEFPDGTVGAVKVEKARGPNWSGSKVLASEEIAVLLRVHHRNLVNMTGFCIHKGRHMLVFEYLANGSLFDRLHQSILTPSGAGASMDSVELGRPYSKVLSWQKRVRIASDVAYGLEYLHHDADPPIVHRDVKSHNILLTATDSAKLADFGLSKAAPAEATTFHSIETLVRGSIGYMDPQYFLTGVFSPKSDVYSYGVVLLELISGHQAIYNAASLASWAAPYMVSPSMYHEVVDKKLDGEFDATQLESLVEISRMCMQEDGKARPNMRQVVAFLNSRQLAVVESESAKQVEDTISRDAYHKMHPMFIDFESRSIDSGSHTNVDISMSNPQPRD